jgi:micrococcal nuclease
MYKKSIVLFIIICISIFSFVFANSSKFSAKFKKASDGDTARFIINGENTRVRFLGINTPEVSGENKVLQPYGNEALAFADEKLKNAKTIELEYDSHADKTDKYDRPLVWVWVDGALYQEEILKAGLARTYMLEDDYKYANRLKTAEDEAKKNKIGIWSDGKSHIFTPSSAMTNANTTEQPTTNIDYDDVDDNFDGYYEYELTDDSLYSAMIVIVIILFIVVFLYRWKNSQNHK